ncbi:MAG: hypothetical protein U0325_00550 [Polyangiales bacterium]
MRARWTLVRWCGGAAGVLLAASVGAQTTPGAVAARALLIEQAEQARDAGDHPAALSLANRAGRIEMTVSLRMFIAEEQLATRSFAAALASSLLCLREAGRDPGLRARDAILTRCREVNQRARSSVALITLRPPAEAADLAVTLDDAPVPPELFDAPQPVDPGAHRVVVRAPGRDDLAETFDAREGEAQTLSLHVGPPRAAAPAPQRVETPVTPRPVAPRPSVAGPVALWTVGAAGVVAAAVFFTLRESSAQGCDIGDDPAGSGERVWRCDTPTQVQAVTGRETWTVLSAASLGVGLLAAGAGLVWWTQRPRAVPLIEARRDGVVLGVGGRW